MMHRMSSEYQTSEDILYGYQSRPAAWRLYINKLFSDPYILLFGSAGESLEIKISTHSTFINVWIKGGILFLLSFIFLVYKIIKYLWKRFGIESGFFLAFIGWILTCIVNENESFTVIIYLVLSIAISEININSKNAKSMQIYYTNLK